jgi:hypothetical protein
MAGFCEISRRSPLRFCELRGGIAKSLQPDPRNIPVFGRLALETRLEDPLHGGPGIKPNGHLDFIQVDFRGTSALAKTMISMGIATRTACIFGRPVLELGSNWTCPYCQHAQVLTSERTHEQAHKLHVDGSKLSDPNYKVVAIVCSNEACRELTLTVSLSEIKEAKPSPRALYRSTLEKWPLLPPSKAKPQPSCVPSPFGLTTKKRVQFGTLAPKHQQLSFDGVFKE